MQKFHKQRKKQEKNWHNVKFWQGKICKFMPILAKAIAENIESQPEDRLIEIEKKCTEREGDPVT